MDKELNDLFFEIQGSFDRIYSNIYFIKRNIKNEDELLYHKEYFHLNTNYLIFYTRALRDKLNDN